MKESKRVTLDRPGGGRRARSVTRSWRNTQEKENVLPARGLKQSLARIGKFNLE
jgi:hypothetical protein